MKEALKETSIFAIGFFSLIAFALSVTSCSQEEAIAPLVASDTYVISIGVESSVSTGLYDGDYHGETDIAKQYLGASEIASTLSVSVERGKTLIVRVNNSKPAKFTVTRNGEEVLELLSKSEGEGLYLFYNK